MTENSTCGFLLIKSGHLTRDISVVAKLRMVKEWTM